MFKKSLVLAIVAVLGLSFCGLFSGEARADELKDVKVVYSVLTNNGNRVEKTSLTMKAYHNVAVKCENSKHSVKFITDNPSKHEYVVNDLAGDCSATNFRSQIDQNDVTSVLVALWVDSTPPNSSAQKVFIGSSVLKENAESKKVWLECNPENALNGKVLTKVTNYDGKTFSVYDSNCKQSTNSGEGYVNTPLKNSLELADFDVSKIYDTPTPRGTPQPGQSDPGDGNGNGNGNGNGSGTADPGTPMTYGGDGQTASILHNCSPEVVGTYNADTHQWEDKEGKGIRCIIELVVDVMTVGIGILAVIGIIVVGVQYLTSGGNDEKAKKAKRRLLEVVIGVVLYVIAYAVLKWLMPSFK